MISVMERILLTHVRGVWACSTRGASYTSAMASVSASGVSAGGVSAGGVSAGVGGVGVLGLAWVGDLVDDFLDFIHFD
jgi:hypothetical protein